MISLEMLEIVMPALVVGVMIALVHAPLGIEVLRRGIIFIDLAIAQIAGLGVVIASTFLHEPSSLVVQAIALSCAIAAGLFFRKVEDTIPAQQEAIIGCSFILAASLAILLLADHPHGGEEIQHMLSGQILFVTWSDILSHLPIFAVVLTLWLLKPGWRSGNAFYLLFALAITSSVQLVGVYVVFASLILPALAVLKAKRAYMMAWLNGLISVAVGIIAATLVDAPAGPMIVLSYVVVAVCSRKKLYLM